MRRHLGSDRLASRPRRRKAPLQSLARAGFGHKAKSAADSVFNPVSSIWKSALPMADLRAMCVDAGFTCVETYIASGNVIFVSNAAPAKVKSELERCLHDYAGKPVGVLIRTAAEMQAVLKANPFPKAPPNYAYAIFLDKPPPRDAIERATGMNGEEMRLGTREIYVHYANGMGQSKLKIPAAKSGTARNLNTVAKLAEMASNL